MQDFESLAYFYLGKLVDIDGFEESDQYYLYESKDLNTHAVILGMTGSGKTGLGIDFIEETAMDNIPALVIDPKGDMANLKLVFSDMQAEDFIDFIDPLEAEKTGKSVEAYAEDVAKNFKEKLAQDDIDQERLEKYKAKTTIELYTPGSNTAKPISIVDLVEAPNEEILADEETLNSYLSSTVSSLLALIGVDANPLNNKEHILISNILLEAWKNSEDITLADLIQLIQEPNINKIGILDLEQFYPQAEREKLALSFNNLLAAPSFSNWLKGESLNINNLLYTESGQAKVSILSIAHLNQNEQIFFVTLLLNKVINWMKTKSGTSSSRAILYMDEISGFMPPVSNPASKKPLLTLLKQARAYGLGLILASQNPGDLDYKGLANIGSWFIGRLQTKQDQEKLLDSLSAVESINQLDRNDLQDIISKLPQRTFLARDVHKDGISLFRTRQTMSYLAGPLSKEQIKKLESEEVSAETASTEAAAEPDETSPEKEGATESKAESKKEASTAKPVANVDLSKAKADIPKKIEEFYLESTGEDNIVYQASLLALVDLAFEEKKIDSTFNTNKKYNTLIKNKVLAVDWSDPTAALLDEDLISKDAESSDYLEISEQATENTNYTQWKKDLKTYIYNNETMTLYTNPETGLISDFEESLQDFRPRVNQALREKRDEAIAEVKEDYQKKVNKLEEKIRKAQNKIEKESGQTSRAKFDTLVHLGTGLLDAFLGRNKLSKTSLNKASRSIRAAGRAKQQSGDVVRAEEDLEVLEAELEQLEVDLKTDLENLADKFNNADDIEEHIVTPYKKDINIKLLAVLWLPYTMDGEGNLSPAYEEV